MFCFVYASKRMCGGMRSSASRVARRGRGCLSFHCRYCTPVVVQSRLIREGVECILRLELAVLRESRICECESLRGL
jgi:hypothetical protein